MKDVFHKKHGAFDLYEDNDSVPDEVMDKFETMEMTDYAKKTVFHIGQSYEETPAKTVRCTECGGTEFYVGSSDYWTGIKCKKCEWEICIHEG